MSNNTTTQTYKVGNNHEVDVYTAGRLIYVDPNQYRSINGTELVNSHEDMCISVDLIAEICDRFNNNENKFTNSDPDAVVKQRMVVSCSTMPMSKLHDESFLNGTELSTGSGITYLDTYYTDIDYRRTQIQGLGISSIDIAFESYIAPTVTIKFVDVRGSAIWAREEEIHNKGKLLDNNVFGCFFTFPYPRFILQVKGFYGKPVTMQLVCTSFKGSFNAQTGNFEADAQFIGHRYAFLSDIPFAYLAAAPHSPYKGFEYFNAQVEKNSNWQLTASDGTQIPMVTLKDYMKKIKRNQIPREELDVTVHSGMEEEMDAAMSLEKIKDRKSRLNEILDLYKKLIELLCKNGAHPWLTTQINEMLDNKSEMETHIVIPFTKTIQYTSKDIYLNVTLAQEDNGQTVEKIAKTIREKSIDYQTEYPTYVLDNGLDTNIIDTKPFGIGSTLKTFNKRYAANLQPKDIGKKLDYELLTNREYEHINSLISDDIPDVISIGILNTGDVIKNALTHLDGIQTIEQYIRKDDDGNETINNEGLQKSDEYKAYQQALQNSLIEQNIGVVPHIGNVIKIILAHLETFMYMIYSCATEIMITKRTASQLGLLPYITDVPNSTGTEKENDYIPPFPAVYEEKEDSQEWIWVGDINHKFAEEELVDGILKATMDIVDSERAVHVYKTPKYNPISPIDVALWKSPYEEVRLDSLDSLAGYLALRAFYYGAIFFRDNSNIDTDTINMFARFDAYNCLYANPQTDTGENFFKACESTDIASTMLDILQCNDFDSKYTGTVNPRTGEARYIFEKINPNNSDTNRHPIIKVNGDTCTYTYIGKTNPHGNGNISFIPGELIKWNNFVGSHSNGFMCHQLNDGMTDNHPLEENYTSNSTAVYWASNVNDLSLWAPKEDENKYPRQANYTNPYLFDILISNGQAESVEELTTRYQGTDGKLLIKVPTTKEDEDPIDETNSIKQIFNLWKTKTEDIFNYYTYYNLMVNEFGTEKKTATDFFVHQPTNGQFRDDVVTFELNPWDSIKYCEYGINGKIKDNNHTEINTDNVCKLYVSLDSTDDFYYLLTHPFYVQQTLLDNDKSRYCSEVKCLLFISSWYHQFSTTPHFLNTNKTSGGIEILPYPLVVLMGGLLWRYRLCEEKDWDDIIEWKGFKTPSSTKQYQYSLYCNTKRRIHVSTGQPPSYLTVAQCFYGANTKLSSDKLESFAPNWHIQNTLINIFKGFVKEAINIIQAHEIYSKETKKIATVKTFNELNEDFLQTYTQTISNKEKNQSYDTKTNKKLMLSDGQSIFTKYIWFCPHQDEGGDALLSEKSPLAIKLKTWWMRKVVITDNEGTFRFCKKDGINENTQYATIPTIVLKSYINSFTDVIKKHMGEGSRELSNVTPAAEDGDTNKYGGMCTKIGIYKYLKDFWDKWASRMSMPLFTLDETYKRFVFIDEFYQNNENELMLNADKLRDQYNYAVRHSTLCHMLDHIGKNCDCVFMYAPTFINMHPDDANDLNKTLSEQLSQTFIPIPYNHIEPPEPKDYFIYMYRGNKARQYNGNNNYIFDSFDLFTCQGNNIQCAAPSLLTDTNATISSDNIRPDGYNIPSFGIAFGKQSQSHFKNLKMAMDNPVVTSHSAEVLASLAQLGSRRGNEIKFVGQDVYNVHSSYAYNVEVESMGNMQIMPFMYFQLLNIPMFRGTYIIQKVTHSISPGDMTTKFIGTKMSKWMLPYNQEFWLRARKHIPPEVVYVNGGGNSNQLGLSGTYPKVTDAELGDNWSKILTYRSFKIWDVQSQSRCDNLEYRSKNEPIVRLYAKLKAEIKLLPENQGTETWTIACNSLFRGSSGQHGTGAAMDIHPVKVLSDGSYKSISKQNEEGKLIYKIVDIIITNHLQEFGRCLLEYNTETDGDNLQPNNFLMLHFESRKNNTAPTAAPDSIPTVWVAVHPSHYTNLANHVFGDALLKKLENHYYQELAAKWWKSGIRDYDGQSFKEFFKTYINISDEKLEAHLNNAGNSLGLPTGNDSVYGSSVYDPNGSKYGIFALDYACKINNVSQENVKKFLDHFHTDCGIDVNLIMMIGWCENELCGYNKSSSYVGSFAMNVSSSKDYRPNGIDFLQEAKKDKNKDVFGKFSNVNQINSSKYFGEQILFHAYFYNHWFKDSKLKPNQITNPGLLMCYQVGPANACKMTSATAYNTSITPSAYVHANGNNVTYGDWCEWAKNKLKEYFKDHASQQDKEIGRRYGVL